MNARLRGGLTTIAALSLVCVVCWDDRVSAAIALDNDVDLSQSNGTPGGGAPVANADVVGAPRLVPDYSSFQGVSVEIDTGDRSVESFNVRLLGYLPETFQPCGNVFLNLGALRPGTKASLESLIIDPIDLGELQGCFRLAPAGLIFVLSGRVTFDFQTGIPSFTITLSGLGNPIIIDELGDRDAFHAGDVVDIPPRSGNLVRTLGELAQGHDWFASRNWTTRE